MVTWHAADGTPGGLWSRLADIGWLPEHRRVVIQCDVEPSRLTWDTLHGLARHYARHRPDTQLQMLMPDGPPVVDWEALAIEPIPAGAAVVVEGLALPEVRVPRLWFESFALITLVEPWPHLCLGLRGVLAAQAAPLQRGGTPAAPAAALAVEAHRLAPSDLAIACGIDAGDAPWWAASASDVSLDCALGAAAGLSARSLPVLRALARHEVLRPGEVLGRPLPHSPLPLVARALPPLWAAGTALGAGARGLLRDARMVRRNLPRVPGALRRRWAARHGGTA